MTELFPGYTERVEGPTTRTQGDQVSQELSRWLWDDMQSPVSVGPDALTRSEKLGLSLSYLDVTLDDLYGALEEPMCRAAGTSDDFPLLASASDRGVTALDGVKDADTPGGASSERAELLQLAKAHIDDPKELAKFKEDMERFDKRASTLVPPLPAEEVARTYEQIGRLLEAKHGPSSPLKEADRIRLAEQVMDQVAAPTTIDQGWHSTCTLTAIEARAYTRTPSEAARLVAEVATTGKYTTTDGQAVQIPPSSIAPADSEAKTHPNDDGDRSHASQIFQVTAVNLYWSAHEYQYTDAAGNVRTVPAGKLKYEQVEPDPGNPDDSGERLVDYSVTPPAVVMDYSVSPPVPVCEPQTDLNDDGAVKWISDTITGKSDTVYIFHDGYENADGRGAVLFDSQKELEDVIVKAKQDGRLPIIMAVHTGQEPFWTDSGGGSAGGSGGWHVVTITDYDPRSKKVSIDNQWGAEADHLAADGIPLGDLYLASRP
jgi:hypothetical protein